MSPLALVMTIALTQNVILVHYLGVYPLPAIIHSPRRAAGMSLAVTAALLWVTAAYWVAYRLALEPLGAEILGTLVLAVIVGGSTIIALRFGTALFPFHRRQLRQGAPAALVNVTVYVVSMSLVEEGVAFPLAVAGALAAGAGLFLALVPMAAIRNRMRTRRMPAALRGDVTVYLAAAMMALAIQQIDVLLNRFFVPIY
jgi:Na+-translocating ferredoxin:NAD+ oxidoreductase subunit A